MNRFLPLELPAPLQKAFFQRMILAVALLLMVVILFATTHEAESFIGLLGTAYFLWAAMYLNVSWQKGSIIAITGVCVSVDRLFGNNTKTVFSVAGLDEATLTFTLPKKGNGIVPSLAYTLYIDKRNHSVIYGLEPAAAENP